MTHPVLLYFALLTCCAPYILAGDSVRAGESTLDDVQEISRYINPKTDGFVSNVIIAGDKVIYAVSGPGLSGTDLEIVASSMGGGPINASVVRVGLNSPLAKRGVFNENPHLVGFVSPDKYLINLVCCKDFPNPTDTTSGGATGNAVLYDAGTKTFSSLTKLDRQSGRSCRALRWFPARGLLLLEQTDLQEITSAKSARATRKPICLKVSDGAVYPIAAFPGINDWYATHAGLEVRRDLVGEGAERNIRWSLRHTLMHGEVVFSSGQADEGLAVFASDKSQLYVSNTRLGTYLVDLASNMKIRVDERVAIACDQNNDLLVVRSPSAKAGKPTRYWQVKLP